MKLKFLSKERKFGATIVSFIIRNKLAYNA